MLTHLPIVILASAAHSHRYLTTCRISISRGNAGTEGGSTAVWNDAPRTKLPRAINFSRNGPKFDSRDKTVCIRANESIGRHTQLR